MFISIFEVIELNKRKGRLFFVIIREGGGFCIWYEVGGGCDVEGGYGLDIELVSWV